MVIYREGGSPNLMQISNKLFKYDLLFLSFIIVLILLAYLSGISILLFLPYALLIVKILMQKSEFNIYLSLFLIPNIRMFDSLSISFLVNSLLFLIFFKYCFIDKKGIHRMVLVNVVILFFLEFTHVFRSGSVAAYVPLVSWLSSWGIAFSVIFDKKLKITKEYFYWYLAIGVLASTLFGAALGNGFMNLITLNPYFRFAGMAGDPNFFATYILLVIFSTQYILERDYQNKNKYVLSFLFFSVLGLLTLSKMFLLIYSSMIGINFILFISLNLKRKNKKQRKFFNILLGAFIIVGILFNDLLFQLINNFITRFSVSNVSGSALNQLTTGRSSLVSFYFSELTSDVRLYLFGNGLSYETTFNTLAVHNTYMDVILSWGVVGIGCLLIIGGYLIYYCSKNYIWSKEVYSYFPLIVFSVTLFSLSFLSADMFPLVLMFVIVMGLEKKQPHIAESDRKKHRKHQKHRGIKNV